jgi:hypothetical protein
MRSSTERGFVLISAMWLLILGAAIAALLMLRSINTARAVRMSADNVMAEHRPDDALATIAADILFAGPASRWSRLPATGTLQIGGQPLAISISREQRLPDVNKADLALIDDDLHDRGYLPEQRATILARIEDARGAKRMIGSFAGIAALAAGVVPPGSETCLAAVLSPFGGTGDRTTSGSFAASQDSSGLHAGDVLRVRLGEAGRQRIHALRITAAADQPYGLLDWYDDACRTAPSAGAVAP